MTNRKEYRRWFAVAHIDIAAQRRWLTVRRRAGKAWTGRGDKACLVAGVTVSLHIDSRQLDGSAVFTLIDGARQSLNNYGISCLITFREIISNHLSLASVKSSGVFYDGKDRG